MTQTQTTNYSQSQTPERRFCAEKAEIRAGADGSPKVFGYALKWGVPYDMGWFTEVIDRNALSGADMSDIRVLLNHDPNIVLGRTKAKTARVGMDETGLFYEADLPDSPNGQNVAEMLRRGDVDQSSWAFFLDADKWEKKDGRDVRTITRVSRVVDASMVTYPANPDTSAAKRSFDMQCVLSADNQGVFMVHTGQANSCITVTTSGTSQQTPDPELLETYRKLAYALKLRAR